MIGTNRATGKRMSGLDHLKQSIIDILSTPQGTRILVRDYGSKVFDLIDNPQDDLTRIRLISATAGALARWEPRLLVERVTVTRLEQGSTDLVIDGIDKESGIRVQLGGITINVN